MLNRGFLLSLVLISFFPTCTFSNERIPANEPLAIQQIVEENIRAEAKNGFAHRDAHLKAHGCVKAKFRVLELPDEIRVGVFG